MCPIHYCCDSFLLVSPLHVAQLLIDRLSAKIVQLCCFVHASDSESALMAKYVLQMPVNCFWSLVHGGQYMYDNTDSII